MKIIGLAALALILAGCTETQRWEASRSVRLDLEAAYARAEAFGDEIAKRCYGELITAARRIEAQTGIVGPADAYQRARNIRRFLDSDAFALACGPLAMDTRSALLRLIVP